MAAEAKKWYNKRSGTAGAHGQFMEINLLTLFKLQGDQKLQEFYLAGNMKEAGNFDDVVFRYKDEGGRQKIIFLQAKSKEHETHKVNLRYFKLGGEWELKKFFESYIAIRDEFNKHRNDDPIFKDGIENVDCNYVIYTNAAKESFSKFTDELGHSPLDVVLAERCGHALRLKTDAVKDIFKEIHDDKEIDQLLELVVKILDGNCKQLHRDEHFQVYRAFFTNKVFIKENSWKLRDEFLEGDFKNKSHIKFREKIFDLYANIKTANKRTQHDKAKMMLKSMIFKLPDSFENQTATFDKQICDEFIEIASVNIAENVCSISKLSKKLLKTIHKLVGNVFLFDENNAKFRLNEQEELDGEPGKFQKHFKESLPTNLGFDFHIEKFPILSLGFTPIDYDQVLEFNSNLTILTGQPNEAALENTIKNQLFHNVSEGEGTRRLFAIKQEVTAWWKRTGKINYLMKDDRFLDKIMKGIIFNLKPQLISFTGRSQELSKLHEALQKDSKDNTAVISQAISVSGLGGIGKSELARQYAHKYQEDYDGNVIWIDAESDDMMTNCFRRLCTDSLNISTQGPDKKEKHISSIVQEVYNFFRNRRSLFVFDNATQFRNSEGAHDGIEAYLPSTKTGNTSPNCLITSRNKRWPGSFMVTTLTVFTDAESEQLVKRQLKITDDEQDAHIRELIKQLENFPLALQQAVAYIRQRNENDENAYGRPYTVKDYSKQFTEKAEQLLDFNFPDDCDDRYSKTTFITWNITLELIEGLELGPEARKIFNIMAFLSPNDIPMDFFKDILGLSEERLSDSVNLLAKYSMINLHKGMANVHRLVQYVARLKMQDFDKTNAWKESLLLVEHHTDYKLIIHGASLWNYACNDNTLVSKFHNVPAKIIAALSESIRYEEATKFGEESLESLKRVLGNEDTGALHAQLQISRALNENGKYQSALDGFQYVFDASKRKLGVDSILTLQAQHYVATGLFNQGKYTEAIVALKEVHQMKSEVLGSDHHETVSTQHKIAQTLSNLGKYDEALVSYREVFEKRTRTLGPGDANTLITQHEIAMTLSRQGKTEEALDSFREVHQLFTEKLGPNHISTLTALHNIAQTLSNQGKYDEALASYREILQQTTKTLGRDHPETLSTQHEIAMTLSRQGKHEEAMVTFREVLERRAEILGPDHPITLLTEHNIAQTQSKQGKYEEALVSYGEVLEKFTEILGPDHPYTVATQHNIAITLQNRNALKFKESDTVKTTSFV